MTRGQRMTLSSRPRRVVRTRSVRVRLIGPPELARRTGGVPAPGEMADLHHHAARSRPDEGDAVVQLPLEAGWIANDNPLDDAPVEELAGPFSATARQPADHLGEALDLRMDRATVAQCVPAS